MNTLQQESTEISSTSTPKPSFKGESTLLKNDCSQISILKLALPILIENILRISLSSVDVLMLSFYSEKAVAAVGLINQFVFFLQVLYLMVAVGASILISQNLGAGRTKDAGMISLGSINLGLVFSAVLSLGMCFSTDHILRLYHLDPQVHKYALQFMIIYSSGSVFVALGMIQGTILRTHGHTKTPMVVNMVANVINIIGNYLFIFGPFGIPVLGVTGVALSTVFSQGIACLVMFFCIRAHQDIDLPFKNILRVPRSIYRQILAIGIPTAGENLSYNIGQIIIMGIIASLGTKAMAATVYSLTILRFVFISSISIGNATQIKVGYFVGAGRPDDAYHKVFRYFFSGVLVSLLLVIVANFIQVPVMKFFTKDITILHLISEILLVSLVLEPGRNFNVIIIPALKGAGDVQFPVFVGMILMWGIGVLFAYVFGIIFGWGLIGVWTAMTCDEWIRGSFMFLRWRNGKWKNKLLLAR